jgi:hypothetical protein
MKFEKLVIPQDRLPADVDSQDSFYFPGERNAATAAA